MYSVIIIILALSFLLLDVGYYARAVVSTYWGKYFQKKIDITGTFVYYGICTIRDADIFFLHMNNSRYLRLLDSARLNFYARTGLYDKLISSGAQAVVGAQTVRYRRPIELFNMYKIETKLLCWDEKTLYFEHKFITLKDDFVRAIALLRTHAVGLDIPTAMADIPNAATLNEVPGEIRQWAEALETASKKLRKQYN